MKIVRFSQNGHAPRLGCFLGQDRVPVLGHAGDDALLARAANAEFAGIVDIDPFIEAWLRWRLSQGRNGSQN